MILRGDGLAADGEIVSGRFLHVVFTLFFLREMEDGCAFGRIIRHVCRDLLADVRLHRLAHGFGLSNQAWKMQNGTLSAGPIAAG